MQLIWQTTKDWKTAAPECLVAAWRQWVGSLANLTHLAFPYWLSVTATDPCQLYVFTDASKSGYGAIAYIGIEEREPTLLFSKNRVVNPLKPTTIPRLELNGALVGARITKTLLEELTCTLSIMKVHFFVDSVVVLHWIRNERTKYGEYVHNRLQEIQGLQDDECFARLAVDFRLIPTDVNPADLVSCGQTMEEFLAADHFWQHVPSFLAESPDRWPPVFPVSADEIDETLEARPSPTIAYVAHSPPATTFASFKAFLEAQLGRPTVDPDVFEAELLNQIKKAQEEAFPRYVAHLCQHHRQ